MAPVTNPIADTTARVTHATLEVEARGAMCGSAGVVSVVVPAWAQPIYRAAYEMALRQVVAEAYRQAMSQTWSLRNVSLN